MEDQICVAIHPRGSETLKRSSSLHPIRRRPGGIGPGHIVTNGGDPFAGVAAVLRDADLTIANLECAIVKEGHAVDKPYTFRGPESALPLLKKYFSAVSLANNHSGDWGKKGFATTGTGLAA